jgi:hypothetical protein
MATKRRERKRIFIDRRVQGALIFRVIVYWIMTVVALTLMLLCWRIVTGPARMFYTHLDDMWFHFGPALIASFVLLPVVIYDIVQMSNRFCGPLFRLRQTMRATARGEHAGPISFREGDFWPEVATEFNAMMARLQAEEPRPEVEPESERKSMAAAVD